MKKILEGKRAITLVALIITIIVLLLLAGIAIASLGGENGIFAKVKQAKKMQLESEMKEQLTIGLQELQVAKKGMATLDDITQEWANEAILSDYSPVLQEDASLNGKLIVMTKDGIKGKFLINQDLSIETIEYNTSSVEVEYTTVSREDNKVKINIVVTDKVNGLKQIDYPEGNPLKVVNGTKDQISIDYEVELGKEYKFVITTGDGNKTEKKIKIDDYFYNVIKILGKGVTIDNSETKAAYNKTYEATITAEDNYIITDLKVTMGGQQVITSENDVIDINTGKIKIEKVTADITITVTTQEKELTPIDYVCSSVWSGYPASNAFDGKEYKPYYWHAVNDSVPQYCGAKFSEKVHIKKFYLNCYYQSINIVLQASNDGENWIDIQSYNCSKMIDTYYVTNEYNEKYNYYCIKTISGGWYVAYYEIKFYGE